jgi:hypothetical protein
MDAHEEKMMTLKGLRIRPAKYIRESWNEKELLSEIVDCGAGDTRKIDCTGGQHRATFVAVYKLIRIETIKRKLTK